MMFMEDNSSIYVEEGIDIHAEVLDKDFDDVAWDPEVVDDSDDEAAEKYGY